MFKNNYKLAKSKCALLFIKIPLDNLLLLPNFRLLRDLALMPVKKLSRILDTTVRYLLGENDKETFLKTVKCCNSFKIFLTPRERNVYLLLLTTLLSPLKLMQCKKPPFGGFLLFFNNRFNVNVFCCWILIAYI